MAMETLKNMKQTFNILEKVILYLWIVLTIVIIYFIVDRFLNPGYKGISNVDLKLYLKVSIIFLVLIVTFKFLKKRS